MAYRLPPLNWVRAFEASARHNSFAAAARELNLTSTAISHQIRCLEQQVGHPLFERRARGVRLTGMGAAYLPGVRDSLEQLSATTMKLFGLGAGSELTVSAPLSFVTLFLAPRLADFNRLYPNVPVQLYTLVWLDATLNDSTDLDIRFGTGNWPGYAAEKIMYDDSVVVVQKSMAEACGYDPDKLRDGVANSPLIHVIGFEDHWKKAFEMLGLAAPTISRSMRVDNSLAALTLVANGAGAAIVLRSHVKEAAKTLPVVDPFDFSLPLKEAHYLLTPQNEPITKPEAVVFKSWLAGQIEEAENSD